MGAEAFPLRGHLDWSATEPIVGPPDALTGSAHCEDVSSLLASAVMSYWMGLLQYTAFQPAGSKSGGGLGGMRGVMPYCTGLLQYTASLSEGGRGGWRKRKERRGVQGCGVMTYWRILIKYPSNNGVAPVHGAALREPLPGQLGLPAGGAAWLSLGAQQHTCRPNSHSNVHVLAGAGTKMLRT